MDKNTKIFFDGIKRAIVDMELDSLKEISISSRKTTYQGTESTLLCLNGTAFVNIGYQTLKYDNIVSTFEKAIKELQKDLPRRYKQIHLVYKVEESDSYGYPCRITFTDWRKEKLAADECLHIVEHFDLCRSNVAYDAVKQYPTYEIRLRAGFAWKGAETERNQTAKEMKELIDWAAAIDVDIDHVNKFILVNGFSTNDMY